MLRPITIKTTDESEAGGIYRFTFYCDICGSPRQSPPYLSDTPAASSEERVQESKAAFIRANNEVSRWFNRCPVCFNIVCDDCYCIFTDKHPNVCKECLTEEWE